MEAKQSVEEKRVKSTIIRRRAKADAPVAVAEEVVETPSPIIEEQEVQEIEVAPEIETPVEVESEVEEAQPAPPVVTTANVNVTERTVLPSISTPPTRRMIKEPDLKIIFKKDLIKQREEAKAAQAAIAAKRNASTPGQPGSQVGTQVKRPGVTSAPSSGIAVATDPAKEKPKKIVKRKSSAELEMEMIDRAGGFIKAVELMESAPERLERVFRPDKNSKKRKNFKKEFRKTEITTPKATKRVVRIESGIIVAELAKRMGVKAAELMKKLMSLGVMSGINHMIDHDTAVLVASEFGYEVENVAFEEDTLLDKDQAVHVEEDKEVRPPVVTVMGHVDHGKTSLLDAIRKTDVAARESGGITQHIGAYDVAVSKGTITFVDTPGHEAFTAMRARGAQVTDLVILVVAGDDGIMPQTVEAIHHAKAAKVPIIVAINKMDKPEADRARVERGLMEHGLISEALGGDTIIVPVSAKTRNGVDQLLEMVLLQAEVMDLKANPKKRANGTIIEARLDKGRGPMATVIVQEGTLRVGDIVVAGDAFGKVRALIDAYGQTIKEAGPSKPVEVLGLSQVPLAGDRLHAVESEDDARKIADHRSTKTRDIRQQKTAGTNLDDFFAQAAKGEIPEVRVIIKSDVQGSMEALREMVTKQSGEKVRVSVLHGGVGAITESDVMLAMASKALIVGFHVRPDAKARELAERQHISIRSYNIIYEVVDDIKNAMAGMLKPISEEKYHGRAEVKQVFTISKVGAVAGCLVQDGKIQRSSQVRLLRDGKIIYTGKISALKRFKDDVKEVANNTECGISIENYNDIKPGDVIEAFAIEEVAAKL